MSGIDPAKGQVSDFAEKGLVLGGVDDAVPARALMFSASRRMQNVCCGLLYSQ
ncbi:hypothetical protein [Radicibacter daui]|uniref:hypothetical protein n=1 Tax=Radicibacter daui TaxID=3064829 RepID=UPI004046FED5